jgi:hypothetical protein
VSGITPIAGRLQKLVPLLASDKSGEVVATVEAISRLLRSHGLDFHDLAKAITAPPPAPLHDNDWARLIEHLLDASDQLSERDVEFLQSVKKFVATGRAPSPKQAKWIRDIRAKLKEAA